MMYSLSDFIDISNKGFDVILPNATVTLINELSHLVGSPNYIKTPVFTKRVSVTDVDKKRRRQRNRIIDTGDGWSSSSSSKMASDESNIGENIVFNPTSSFVKKDGVGATPIQLIRPLLNKVGSKTANQHIKEELFSVLDNILDSDITQEELSKLLVQILDIVSGNLFYSGIYARLFSEMIESHSMFTETLDVHFSKYMTTYSDIQSVDPKEDYDAFCTLNKTNDHREAITSFYINLYGTGNISQYNMLDITKKIVCMIRDNIYKIDEEQLINELVKNVFILMSPDSDLFSRCRDIMIDPTNDTESDEPTISICDYITQLAGSTQKMYPGLNTKSLFKLKDLIDNHPKA